MHRPVLLLLACGLAACDATHDTPTPPSAMHHASMMRDVLPTPQQRRDMARLREVTARFHDRSASEAAGYTFAVPGCFSDAKLGGMGFHFGNPKFIDGVVEADNPEFLLYEPTKSGGLQFVAVEYAVPFTAWTLPTPPELFGIPFHRNEDFGLWIMHVWHIRENPSGAFFDWNPRVSCDNAPA
jgi:hypothetical protein